VRGHFALRTAGRHLTLGPSEFVVCDDAEPVGSLAASVLVRIPRARLGPHADHADRFAGIPLPGERGIGAVLRAFVVGLTDRLGECEPADAIRLAGITTDLVRAVFAHHFRGQDTASAHLRTRIDEFIRRNLSDPDLSPAMIAAEHRISLRYLYKLFAGQELSVAATIRGLRLEGCRSELASPGPRPPSIRSVCSRWGFPDAAQFSRAFRQAYGRSPRDYQGGISR
jgi:AraC-like DNA-binding protein